MRPTPQRIPSVEDDSTANDSFEQEDSPATEVQEATPFTQAQRPLPTTDVEDVNRYYDVNRYRSKSKNKSNRKIVVIAVVAVVLLLIGGVAIAAGLYISNINNKLSSNVTNELREQLVKKEAGDPFYLLLLGVDRDQGRVEDTENYGSDAHAYRSDSIMLCRIDPKNVKVSMVSIHRDTLVKMDEHGNQKINASYAFGGAAYATKTVSIFSGVPISHYAEIDLDRFIGIVDQVGGVTVDLPVPVNDPEYTGLNLPAGKQTLNGTDAALLCRCRHGYDNYGDGDVFRAANQRMVFSAVIKKVLASDPATIASTVASMADSVTTDMDVAAILDLAMQMKSLNVEEDISTGMEPTDGALIGDTWYEICLVDQWKKMMMRVDQGLPPYDETQGEHDSTAGIAGGVGQEGQKAANAAVEADRQEAVAQQTSAPTEELTE
ncbi:MAG: LCP family protein [Atopobiaceae bacterium]|nr:LCP family protein [Atopobiaceae bacterium]